MNRAGAPRLAHEAASTGQGGLGLGQLAVSLALTGGVVYALAGLPRIPTGLPTPPADLELQLELLVRGPTPAQLDAVAGLLGWAFWLGWGFLLGTTLLRIGVVVAERVAGGAAWVRSLRWVSDALTLPFVQRAVDASLAGSLVLRVALATPDAALASAAPMVQVQVDGSNRSTGAPPRAAPRRAILPADVLAELQPADVVHVVKRGESLWSIADRYLGDPNAWKQIYADNRHRPQPSHGSLQEAGKIYEDWLLIIHPTELIEVDADGRAWHTVRHGESLWRIAEDVCGDGTRWPELFDANVGLSYQGYVLSDPDVIQPGMRLNVDGLVARAPAPQQVEAQPAPTAPPAPPVETPPPAPTPPAQVAPPPPTAEAATPAPTGAEPTEAVAPTPEPTSAPATPAPTPAPDAAAEESRRSLSPEQAALAAGLAGAALLGGRLVVHRRRPAPIPTEPESDVRIEDGFAEDDPTEDLARRLARSSHPAAAVASLLGQAYAAVFDEQLQDQEREDAVRGVSVAATRHGRTSTTLVLAAPVAARPHLVRCMRASAERAFGEQVDVDGLVGQDGDVLVRVTWDPRRPIAGQLLERVNAGSASSIWPMPCLVPGLVLRDRQRLSINWHALSRVLVAAPPGQGADVPLVALVAALASVRAPEDLGLVVVARPRTLPDEIGVLPHGLTDVVDPMDADILGRRVRDLAGASGCTLPLAPLAVPSGAMGYLHLSAGPALRAALDQRGIAAEGPAQAAEAMPAAHDAPGHRRRPALRVRLLFDPALVGPSSEGFDLRQPPAPTALELGVPVAEGVTMAGIDYPGSGRAGVRAWSAGLADPADAWDAGGQPPIGIVHRERAGFAPSFARTLGAAVGEAVVATRVQEPEAVAADLRVAVCGEAAVVRVGLRAGAVLRAGAYRRFVQQLAAALGRAGAPAAAVLESRHLYPAAPEELMPDAAWFVVSPDWEVSITRLVELHQTRPSDPDAASVEAECQRLSIAAWGSLRPPSVAWLPEPASPLFGRTPPPVMDAELMIYVPAQAALPADGARQAEAWLDLALNGGKHGLERALGEVTGSRLPAHMTSLGKALLACHTDAQVRALLHGRRLQAPTPMTLTGLKSLLVQLEQVRARGFAVNDQETVIGLRSAAAAIRGHEGAAVAALNVALSAAQHNLQDLLDHAGPRVAEAACEISTQLGYRPAREAEWSR